MNSIEITALRRFPQGLEIFPDDSYCAPEGFGLVMTVNGVGTPIVPGKYEGDVVFQPVKKIPSIGITELPKFSAGYKDAPVCYEHDYRTALFVNTDDTGAARVIRECSADSAITGGVITDSGITGGRIASKEDDFNGILVQNGSYRIQDVTIDFDGNGGDDFEFYGAAITAAGCSRVIIDNADIKTRGIIRTAVACGEKADMLVENSVISTEGTDNSEFFVDAMTEAPWVLGISGTVRSTNVLGSPTATFYNVRGVSNGWGVYSTDDVADCRHNLVNSSAYIARDSAFGSGYGAYVLSTCTSRFLGVSFDVPSYGLSCGGSCKDIYVGPSSRENLIKHLGESSLLAQETNGYADVERRDSVISSGRFGVLWHDGPKKDTGTLHIEPGTRFHTGEAVFMIKSQGGFGGPGNMFNPGLDPKIIAEGAVLRSDNGVILHLCESDDPGMGKFGHDKFWAEYYEVPTPAPEAFEGHDPSDENAKKTVSASFRAMELKGDFYNTHWKSPQNLLVTLDGTALEGRITSGMQYHLGRKPGERIYPADLAELGRFGVNAGKAAACGAIAKLTNGSKWAVTGPCFLSKLIVEDGCAVAAAQGRRLRVSVNGSETAIVPGVYSGDIRIDVE